jgi:tetratricopeptide (TPR) repeat protein
MNREALQKQLNEGIQAVRAGHRHRARELLMAVVADDETNEPAWLWLSAALDEPADQLRAMENVLALNPRQPQALAGVEKLRLALGLPASAAAESPPPLHNPDPPVMHPAAPAISVAPSLTPISQAARTTVFAVEPDPAMADEDPYQCAYCGKPATPDDTRCPHCRRSLLTAGVWHGGTYLYVTLILVGLLFQTAMIEAVAVYLSDNFPNMLSFVPFVSLLTTNVFLPALARVLIWMVVLFVLLDEASYAFAVAVVVALADLIWTGLGYSLGWLSPVLAGLNALLSGSFGLVALFAVISRAQSTVRLKVMPARNVAGAIALHRQAQANARKGQWALAALHWQRAIARAPREPKYYKSLGQAQMRLGRYLQAAKSFGYGAELDPADGEFRRLIESVKRKTG